MSFRTVLRLSGSRSFQLAKIAAAVVAVALGSRPTFAQSSASGTPTQSFDSVTVKPSTSTDKFEHLQVSPYQFNDLNVTVRKLIAFAYGINGYQITGAPDWVDTERFDVEGKWKDGPAPVEPTPVGPPPPPGSPDNHLRPLQLQGMVRGLLKDKFHLKLTPGTQQMDVYDLVAAGGGAKLTPTAAPQPRFQGEPIISLRVRTDAGKGELTLSDGTVGALAGFLSDQIGQQVVDKTGIKGNYDIRLEWDSQHNATDSIAHALEEQLGLKLETQRGPVAVMAVAGVEKPQEDH